MPMEQTFALADYLLRLLGDTASVALADYGGIRGDTITFNERWCGVEAHNPAYQQRYNGDSATLKVLALQHLGEAALCSSPPPTSSGISGSWSSPWPYNAPRGACRLDDHGVGVGGGLPPEFAEFLAAVLVQQQGYMQVAGVVVPQLGRDEQVTHAWTRDVLDLPGSGQVVTVPWGETVLQEHAREWFPYATPKIRVIEMAMEKPLEFLARMVVLCRADGRTGPRLANGPFSPYPIDPESTQVGTVVVTGARGNEARTVWGVTACQRAA